MPYNQLIFTQRKKKIVGISCIVLISIYFAVLAILANSDLLIGRHVLFIDELITFDGVKHLLHPENWADFTFHLLDGNDHRYGRILWNISALFSALPEHFYGATGQIIATRITHFSALLAAYLIFTFTFFPTWKFRTFALLLLLSLPSTHYYASMPKPEPLQLLFLAIFLWMGKKNQYGFGVYWIFLGLAFGAKISILPIIPLFSIIAIVVLSYQFRDTGAWKKPFIAIGSLFIGFLIAEPLNLLSIYRCSWEPTDFYIRQTFKNTGHGSDNLAVSWRDWLAFILDKFTTIPRIMIILTVIGSALLLACILYNCVRNYRQWRTKMATVYLSQLIIANQGLILCCAGVMLFAPIVFMVKRVWGFYLHNSLVMLSLGILVMIETSFSRIKKSSRPEAAQIIVSAGLVFLLLVQTLLFLAPKSTQEFITLSQRTNSADFKRQIAEYEYITRLLKASALTIDRPVNYFIGADLFDMGLTEFYKGNLVFGPFLKWAAGADIVIYYKEHSLEYPLPEPTNVLYEKILAEKYLFSIFVAPDIANCNSDPCYVRLNTTGKGIDEVRIFVRSNIFQMISSLQ